jgi:membrane-associated phospholipid phosphatase
MFALTPFVLKTPAQLRAFAWTFIAMIVVATPCFLLFPGDRRQASVESGVGWQSIVTFARTVALEHNYIPSLHVAFAVAGAWIFAREGSTAIRTSLAAWAITLIASTLLLHQHYLVDVVAGAALGVAGVRQVYDRLTTFSSETTSAANIVSQSQRASR